MKKYNNLLAVILFSVMAISCAVHYTTPGADVKISNLADEDISKILQNKPGSVKWL